jgi:hypothetical protein
MRAEEEEKERLKGLMIGICSFLESTYKEEIYKITLERDQTLHYDVELDLLAFLYYFPFEGAKFHDFPKEFLKFLKQCFIAVQTKLIAEE